MWLPREEYELADYVSRIVESDEWSVHWSVYNVYGGRMSVTGFQMSQIYTVADLTADIYAQVLRQSAHLLFWRGVINWVCPPSVSHPESF